MCYRPIHLKSRDAIVPCGKCPKCIARRVSAWSFRLQEELKVSSSAHFITLTYATSHVPINYFGQLTLDKRDLQLFFKRLRQSHIRSQPKGEVVQNSIKYYACGEYGGRTRRPHYHAILFNAQLELIQPAWDKGNIHYGDVTGASVGYTLKYMNKNKRAFRLSKFDVRNPEFAVMSKGLGISYLSESICNWHVQDIIKHNYCTLPGGAKIGMPRYYKEKLYFELEREAIAEANRLIQDTKQIRKLETQTAQGFKNEMAAIDAAYDRMWRASIKTVI